MSITNPGWHLLSTTAQQTWSQATNAWGISNFTVYRYIYELKNAPIQTGVTLTKDNWTQIDITTNPILMPMTAYWVNIQAVILNQNKIFNGSGELTNATSQLNGASNVIIQVYTSIGNQAFSGATTLTSITIPASVTSIVSNAFNGSGLKKVIFESISNLESLGLIIQDTPQSFFGATGVQVLPKQASVITALSAANAQVATKLGQFANAQLAVSQAHINVSIQNLNDSWAVQQANDQLTNAQNQLTIAQNQLTTAQTRVLKLSSALSWAVV
jgi:hypothetical protein